LSDQESLRLAAGMLAVSEFPPELRDLIVRKAEGNPFFVEEVLKSLLEVGSSGSATAATCSRSPSLRSTSPIPFRM